LPVLPSKTQARLNINSTDSLCSAQQEQAADFLFFYRKTRRPRPLEKYSPLGIPHSATRVHQNRYVTTLTLGRREADRAFPRRPFHLLFRCSVEYCPTCGAQPSSIPLPPTPTHPRTRIHRRLLPLHILPISPPPPLSRYRLSFIPPLPYCHLSPSSSPPPRSLPSPPPSPLTPPSLQSSRRILLRSCDPSKGRTTSRIPRRTDHRPPSTHSLDRAHACTHRISSHLSAPLHEVKQQQHPRRVWLIASAPTRRRGIFCPVSKPPCAAQFHTFRGRRKITPRLLHVAAVCRPPPALAV
jgi:hypothetical protein